MQFDNARSNDVTECTQRTLLNLIGTSGSSNLKDAGTVSIDWLRQQNTSDHHTNEYENDALVLRRGATFDIKLTFQDISFSKIMETVLKFSIGKSQV